MNKLIEKAFKTQEATAYHETISEIQVAAEANPAEWLPILEDASLKAHEEAQHAAYLYSDTLEAVRANPTTEAKAAAWDAYWDRENLRVLDNDLYEQFQNVGFIVGMLETPEGKADWKKHVAEQEEKAELAKLESIYGKALEKVLPDESPDEFPNF